MVSISPRPAPGNAGAPIFYAPTEPNTPPRKFAKASPGLLADTGLTPSEKLLLLALSLDDWKPAAERYYPSNAELARAIGLKPRAVQKLLAALDAKGRIRIEPSHNPTHRVIHRVQLAPDPAEAAHSSASPPRPPVRPNHVPECASPRAPQCAHSRPLPSDRALDDSQDAGRGSEFTNGNGPEGPSPSTSPVSALGESPTQGQAAFLASLTPRRREKFFSLSAAMRRTAGADAGGVLGVPLTTHVEDEEDGVHRPAVGDPGVVAAQGCDGSGGHNASIRAPRASGMRHRSSATSGFEAGRAVSMEESPGGHHKLQEILQW